MTSRLSDAYAEWRDRFAEVLDARLYDLAWLDEQVRSGRALVWAADDAAMLTEMRTYPTGARDIHGLVAAGKLETIVGELIPRAERWAQTVGCIGAVIESRQGWVRALEGSGYRVHQVALWKEF